MIRKSFISSVLLILTFACLLPGWAAGDAVKGKALYDKYCKSCHVPGQPGYVVSGFELRSYETLMKGTQFGPVVLPGDALTSVLVMLIEGRVSPALKMPHGEAPAPTPEEVLVIRRWVEQGAKNN